MIFQNRLGFFQDKGSVDYIGHVNDEGVIATVNGERTTSELEREAYITDNIREAAMWAIVQDLETALDVASRLEE
jgi:hypothetical protein